MKKSTVKLKLNSETVRILRITELAVARGGVVATGAACTDNTMRSDCCSVFDLCAARDSA